VRGVAGETVFDNRRVIPEKRTPQISVAFEALLVDILRFHQPVCNSPVGIMAVRALDLPFPDGMV
jgi:hypothetical protein